MFVFQRHLVTQIPDWAIQLQNEYIHTLWVYYTHTLFPRKERLLLKKKTKPFSKLFWFATNTYISQTAAVTKLSCLHIFVPHTEQVSLLPTLSVLFPSAAELPSWSSLFPGEGSVVAGHSQQHGLWDHGCHCPEWPQGCPFPTRAGC